MPRISSDKEWLVLQAGSQKAIIVSLADPAQLRVVALPEYVPLDQLAVRAGGKQLVYYASPHLVVFDVESKQKIASAVARNSKDIRISGDDQSVSMLESSESRIHVWKLP